MSSSLHLRKRADKTGSEPDLENGESWPLAGVDIMGDPPSAHSFSRDFVLNAATEGWMTLGQGSLTLHLLSGDLVYRIVEAPHDGFPEFRCELEA